MSTKITQNPEKEKDKQKIYNQKWLSKLPEEDRKKYFRVKVRESRGWKCSRCETDLSDKVSYKTDDTKERLCVQCTITDLRKRLAIQEKKEQTT